MAQFCQGNSNVAFTNGTAYSGCTMFLLSFFVSSNVVETIVLVTLLKQQGVFVKITQ